MMASRRVLFKMRSISASSCKKIKVHTLCLVTFFITSCRLWDNVEKYVRARQDTDNGITRRMRFVWLITKATDMHSEYIIVIAFPRQQWLRERASVLHILPVLFKEIIVAPKNFNILVGGGSGMLYGVTAVRR